MASVQPWQRLLICLAPEGGLLTLASAMAVSSAARPGSWSSRLGVREPSDFICRVTGMTLEGRDAQIARAHLLEFLKFRVLAAQEQFFTTLGPADQPDRVAKALRAWLGEVNWPEALHLSDADLLATLETARHLYVN